MDYARANATVGIYGGEKPATQLNPLPAAVNSLGFSIGQLESTMTSLLDRLGKVLTPQAPLSTGNDKQQLGAAPPPTSDLTGEVAHQSRRIDLIAMTLGDLLSRLEV